MPHIRELRSTFRYISAHLPQGLKRDSTLMNLIFPFALSAHLLHHLHQKQEGVLIFLHNSAPHRGSRHCKSCNVKSGGVRISHRSVTLSLNGRNATVCLNVCPSRGIFLSDFKQQISCVCCNKREAAVTLSMRAAGCNFLVC